MRNEYKMKIDKSERGQSLVELAISITVILFLLSGAVEFGITFFQFIQMRDAAQEGALYGSINPSDTSGIVARVRAASSSPIDLSVSSGPNAVVVNVTKSGSGCVADSVTVEVKYNHRIFMPFFPQFIGSSTIPLTASVTDTILQSSC
jgi:Flp pilus assembly protein TadG